MVSRQHINEHRKALAEILEYAKVQRDLADHPHHWERVVELAYNALYKPNMAQIDELLKSESHSVKRD